MVVSQVMTAATVTVAQAAVGPIPGQPLTPPAVLPLFLGVPLALMALAVLAPWRQARNALSLIGPLITGVAGAWLFSYTAAHGTIAHSVGLYVGGVAIPFAGDQFSALMIVTASVVIFVANWFAIIVGETRARFYPALSLMLLAGCMGGFLTADLFNFFVFVEVMLLPSYGLLAMTGTWARMSSGRTFVLVNLTASTMLLIGVCFIYATAGAVNIAALRGAAAGNGPVTVAVGIVVLAMVVKAGLFPVHTWLPRTYPQTSASVMALFSSVHTKIAVYILFRIYVVIFDLDPRWMWPIVGFCVVSMVVGSFAGLGEKSLRRVLAYQMVGGIPLIVVMLAFSYGQPSVALAAGIFYMVHHMITVGSLILTAGAIEDTYGEDLLSRLSGLARRDPWVAAVFAAGAFSVVGFPPFSGLWGKVLTVTSIAQAGSPVAWLVIAVVVVTSFAAFISMLRVWRKVFWGAEMNRQRIPENLRVPAYRIAPAGVLMLISVGMFLAAGPMVQATRDAADSLVNVADYQHAVLGDDLADAVGIPAPQDS